LIKRLASALDRLVAGIEAVVVLFALASLLFLSSWQILMRNLERPSPGWIDPFLHQMVLWAGFLGASLAVRSHGHIRFDLAGWMMSARMADRVAVLVRIVSAAVCLLLARASLTFALEERAREAEIAGIPAWIFPMVIPAAFVFMVVHFLLAPRAVSNHPGEVAQPGGGSRI
jgi:TRAP-type C4-dicarboxylate transport system permease small subunit